MAPYKQVGEYDYTEEGTYEKNYAFLIKTVVAGVSYVHLTGQRWFLEVDVGAQHG